MKFRIKNKSKKIFIVYSEEKLWGILPEKILPFFSFDLKEEVELSKEKSEELKKYITEYANGRLLNFLSFRERSKWECKFFLKQLPLAEEFSEELLKKARSNNLIDDERFAEIYIDHLIGKGKNATESKNKLFEKHISGEIIMEVISAKYSAEIEEDILTKNAEKVLTRYSKFQGKERIEKCLNYLTGRGFSYYDAREKIHELIMKD